MTKRCNRCDLEKDASEFYRQRDVSDGLSAGCKACKKAYQNSYRQAHSDQTKAAVNRWHRANRDRLTLYQQQWRAANPEWVRDHARRWYGTRRARKLDQFVEQVSAEVVLERADGVCGICGGDVDPLAFHVDHIVALAKGGEHSYENSQPAHPVCNLRKHTKSMEEVLWLP